MKQLITALVCIVTLVTAGGQLEARTNAVRGGGGRAFCPPVYHMNRAVAAPRRSYVQRSASFGGGGGVAQRSRGGNYRAESGVTRGDGRQFHEQQQSQVAHGGMAPQGGSPVRALGAQMASQRGGGNSSMRMNQGPVASTNNSGTASPSQAAPAPVTVPATGSQTAAQSSSPSLLTTVGNFLGNVASKFFGGGSGSSSSGNAGATNSTGSSGNAASANVGGFLQPSGGNDGSTNVATPDFSVPDVSVPDFSLPDLSF